MEESLNRPYVKKYENGQLVNPIKDIYLQEYPNRRQRRYMKNVPNFRGNTAGFSLTIVGQLKYYRRRQFITTPDGETKAIDHYTLHMAASEKKKVRKNR